MNRIFAPTWALKQCSELTWPALRSDLRSVPESELLTKKKTSIIYYRLFWVSHKHIFTISFTTHDDFLISYPFWVVDYSSAGED